MKIPIFEEINFENFDDEVIIEKLSSSKIAKVPTFINLTELKKNEKEDIILKLKSHFLYLNLSPRFPYPCYLICEKGKDSYFPTCASIKELPDHFFKKVKRPNNKEIQLLNKLALKVEKIKNLDLNRINDELLDTAYSQKKLYQNTKELYFLELLNYKLFERSKEKHKNGKKIS